MNNFMNIEKRSNSFIFLKVRCFNNEGWSFLILAIINDRAVPYRTFLSKKFILQSSFLLKSNHRFMHCRLRDGTFFLY